MTPLDWTKCRLDWDKVNLEVGATAKLQPAQHGCCSWPRCRQPSQGVWIKWPLCDNHQTAIYAIRDRHPAVVEREGEPA